MTVSQSVWVLVVAVMSVSQSVTETQLEESINESMKEESLGGLNILDTVQRHPWITKEIIAILGVARRIYSEYITNGCSHFRWSCLLLGRSVGVGGNIHGGINGQKLLLWKAGG